MLDVSVALVKEADPLLSGCPREYLHRCGGSAGASLLNEYTYAVVVLE